MHCIGLDFLFNYKFNPFQDSGCRSTSLTGKLKIFQECNMDEEPEFVEFSQ